MFSNKDETELSNEEDIENYSQLSTALKPTEEIELCFAEEFVFNFKEQYWFGSEEGTMKKY